MDFKEIIIYFVMLVTVQLAAGKSFTIVLDTTLSMELEIAAIKSNFPALAEILDNNTNFDNFVLVPFNDADIISPMVTKKARKMVEFFNSITGEGGDECAEDSLSAIEKSLQISQQESHIYVFTNGNAKYADKMQDIQSMCQNTRSRVVIFLSGSCSPLGPGGAGYLDVYYKIASACSGAVFRISTVNLRKVFFYMKDMIVTDYNYVKNYDAFEGLFEFSFTVDSLTSDILIFLSGVYPSLIITDTNGYSPDVEKILDTRLSLALRARNLNSGVYRVHASSQGFANLTFYKSNRLVFEYGFSTRIPQTLKETSLRPIPGWTNYILIKLQEEVNVIINEIELEFVGSNQTKRAILQKIDCSGCYVAAMKIDEQKGFKMMVIGRDKDTYNEVTGATKLIEVQNSQQQKDWAAPTNEIFMPDSNLIMYDSNATLICKVSGYPKPNMWWQDDQNNTLPSEEVLLEIPSIHLSYVNIVKLASNITVYCKSQNVEGNDTQSIELYVNRTYIFEILQKPSGQAIQFGTTGKLYCEVNAYPEAEIKWYLNDFEITYSDDIEYNLEEHALIIKNMTLDYVGNYICEVSNEANREQLLADVSIAGLEVPEVNLPTEVVVNPEDSLILECRLGKGVPIPSIKWDYRSNKHEDFEMTLPDEVFIKGNNLKFSSIKIEHNGIYRCTAVNMVGEDSAEVDLKVQYAPIISDSEHSTLTVKEGNVVELPCEVDAIPEATVKWEMYQDDVIINLDYRHSTNTKYTHRFPALDQDSGNYHCIAQNKLGVTEKIITVNVLVPPYIQPPVSNTVSVTAGSTVSFPCNVLYGNPVPSTMWEFIAVDSTVSILLRGTSNRTTLNLTNVNKKNEGQYLCIVENEAGSDRIRIYLRVI